MLLTFIITTYIGILIFLGFNFGIFGVIVGLAAGLLGIFAKD